ncbi:basic salivary proline-rich protein 1-like [Empidonax traillii]|uniref:basic salivary proline-rich protein 1-like n=1 Tax=Empidonax traillii TaxID=164674 RepID=UPI000FFD0E32|nr:basic salivary proline-rich protein 1-like [Empidonax traillii]
MTAVQLILFHKIPKCADVKVLIAVPNHALREEPISFIHPKPALTQLQAVPSVLPVSPRPAPGREQKPRGQPLPLPAPHGAGIPRAGWGCSAGVRRAPLSSGPPAVCVSVCLCACVSVSGRARGLRCPLGAALAAAPAPLPGGHGGGGERGPSARHEPTAGARRRRCCRGTNRRPRQVQGPFSPPPPPAAPPVLAGPGLGAVPPAERRADPSRAGGAGKGEGREGKGKESQAKRARPGRGRGRTEVNPRSAPARPARRSRLPRAHAARPPLSLRREPQGERRCRGRASHPRVHEPPPAAAASRDRRRRAQLPQPRRFRRRSAAPPEVSPAAGPPPPRGPRPLSAAPGRGEAAGSRGSARRPSGEGEMGGGWDPLPGGVRPAGQRGLGSPGARGGQAALPEGRASSFAPPTPSEGRCLPGDSRRRRERAGTVPRPPL